MNSLKEMRFDDEEDVRFSGTDMTWVLGGDEDTEGMMLLIETAGPMLRGREPRGRGCRPIEDIEAVREESGDMGRPKGVVRPEMYSRARWAGVGMLTDPKGSSSSSSGMSSSDSESDTSASTDKFAGAVDTDLPLFLRLSISRIIASKRSIDDCSSSDCVEVDMERICRARSKMDSRGIMQDVEATELLPRVWLESADERPCAMVQPSMD